MNKPSTRNMILGHPVISGPFMLAGAVTVGAGLYDGNLPAVAVGAVVGGMALDASQKVKNYRAWAKEWDAHGLGPTPAGKRSWRTIIAGGLGALLWAVTWAGGMDPARSAVFTLMVVGTALVALALLKAAFRGVNRPAARQTAKSAVVTVVARPPVFIPSLQDAYRALPPYCHALLVSR